MPYAVTLVVTFLINIPSGYLRENQRKYSLLWFLFIHLPVPFIILLRKYFEIEHSWTFTPILVLLYFSGQHIGKMVNNRYKKLHSKQNEN